jgi:hypothetical protein
MRSAIILLTFSAAVLAAPTSMSMQTRAIPDIRVEIKDGSIGPVVTRAIPDINKIISDPSRIVSRDASGKDA